MILREYVFHTLSSNRRSLWLSVTAATGPLHVVRLLTKVIKKLYQNTVPTPKIYYEQTKQNTKTMIQKPSKHNKIEDEWKTSNIKQFKNTCSYE